MPAGHMPRCHSPFLVSNLPFSSVTAINQAPTPWWRGPSGSVHQARRGLYEGCQLTQQHSPPPHLDKGKDLYCPQTHADTHTSVTPQTTVDEHKEKATSEWRAATRCREESATQKLWRLPTAAAAAHRPDWCCYCSCCCSIICLMFPCYENHCRQATGCSLMTYFALLRF